MTAILRTLRNLQNGKLNDLHRMFITYLFCLSNLEISFISLNAYVTEPPANFGLMNNKFIPILFTVKVLNVFFI